MTKRSYILRYGGTDEQGERVGPRQQLVLLPPALHNQTDVEAQHERHGYTLALGPKVLAQFLEYPAVAVVFIVI